MIEYKEKGVGGALAVWCSWLPSGGETFTHVVLYFSAQGTVIMEL